MKAKKTEDERKYLSLERKMKKGEIYLPYLLKILGKELHFFSSGHAHTVFLNNNNLKKIIKNDEKKSNNY